jgi:hypothetical protein
MGPFFQVILVFIVLIALLIWLIWTMSQRDEQKRQKRIAGILLTDGQPLMTIRACMPPSESRVNIDASLRLMEQKGLVEPREGSIPQGALYLTDKGRQQLT